MPSTLRHVSPTPGRPDAVPRSAAGEATGDAPGVVAAATPGLAALRAELDGLDDALHDTLMRRAEVVGRIARLGVKGAVPLRPGREASIVHRLLARHTGPFPAAGIVCIWRELICACTSLQRPLLIAVCEAGGDPAYLAAAREHFGSLVPVRVRRTPAEALHEARTGAATAAVLPLPAEDEAPDAAWWVALLHGDGPEYPAGDPSGRAMDGAPESAPESARDGASEPRPRVVARLPFWGAPRPEGAPGVDALVVSAALPDPSGADRSLLGLQAPAGCDRERLAGALAAAGFAAGPVIVRRDPGDCAVQALADVEGFVTEGDPRLAAFADALGTSRPPVVLGAYAVPVSGPPVGDAAEDAATARGTA